MTPRSILLVIPRRIGDVLLTTPLLRSLRRAWPGSQLDVLVFAGTEGILSGNPDINSVITVSERPDWRQHLAFIRSLWRRYDLALSALPGDRPCLYAWAAGKIRIAPINLDKTAVWKRRLLDAHVPFDDLSTHTVAMALRLTEPLGIAPCFELVPPSAGVPPPGLPESRFAVIHPSPKFNYKMWREEGWIALSSALHAKGLQVLLTGSGDTAEVACCARIAAASDAVSLAGQLSLAQTADILRRAAFFAGPDTVMTHLAAACCTPTLALFGPTNPVKWGPWPCGWQSMDSPWNLRGSARQSNVLLLQGSGDCVPCRVEGCDRHTGSFSRCLLDMADKRVIASALSLLELES